MRFLNDDQEALYNAIVEAPDDDAPRLIYSDWLEEHGDTDRADFIRLQIRISKMKPYDPEAKLLTRQEQEFLLKHEIEWINELPSAPGIKWESFTRGFIRAVRIASPEALELAPPDLFQNVPLTAIRFHNFDPASVELIYRTPFLCRNLRELDFDDGNRIGSDGLGRLVQDPRFARVRHLKLRGNNIGPAGVSRLVNSKNSNGLSFLDLDRNDIFPEGARAIAQSPYLESLNHLSLDRTQLGDEGVSQLLSGEKLQQLVSLHLSGDHLGNQAAILLGNYPFRNLAFLYLNSNLIEDAGGQVLLASRYFQKLEYFYLRNNRLTDEVIPTLLGNRQLRQVKELVLGENRFSDLGNEQLRQHFGSRVWLY
ncbi:MAG: TIGR02996 domain-containing protein [Gemmataceae bacterium]|nr:TIGR02996 domain-containing protein [Gemmataceae bacterium]